jgi:hypothetical protein
MDCTDIRAYSGDPSVLFSACCPSVAAAPAPSYTCPTISASDKGRTVAPHVKRSSETLTTCTYSDTELSGEADLPLNPWWDFRDVSSMGEGTEGRQRVCSFLNFLRATPPGFDAHVSLAGEHRTNPAVFTLRRNFRDSALTAAALPERETCTLAMTSLPDRFRALMAARTNHTAGLGLPRLGTMRYNGSSTSSYAERNGWPAGSWENQVRVWQGQLRDNLNVAASSLGSSLAMMRDGCWPNDGYPEASAHLGNYGRLMGELMTAGMSNATPPISTEEPQLNADGVAMCINLAGRLAREAAGKEEEEEDALMWWADPSAVTGCYEGVTTTDAASLAALLGGGTAGALTAGDAKVLDAFRLVRGWKVRKEGGDGAQGEEGPDAAVESCRTRTAKLHRWLHNASVFYHGTPFLAMARDPSTQLPAACRMTEAEIRDDPQRSIATATVAEHYPACGVPVRDLCGAVVNWQDNYPDGFGAGVLRSQLTPSLKAGDYLKDPIPVRDPSVDPTMGSANEMIVALARSEAALAHAACSAQFINPDVDEETGYIYGGNLCRLDAERPWQFSKDPGRGQCGRAIKRVKGTGLQPFVQDWPTEAEESCVWDAADDSRSCCCEPLGANRDIYMCQL